MESAKNQLIASIRKFLFKHGYEYNSVQELEQALKSLREEVFDEKIFHGAQPDSDSILDEVALWTKKLMNAQLYNGVDVFESDAELEIFLRNNNTLRSEQFREKLVTNDRERRARILDLISGKDQSVPPNEPLSKLNAANSKKKNRKTSIRKGLLTSQFREKLDEANDRERRAVKPDEPCNIELLKNTLNAMNELQ